MLAATDGRRLTREFQFVYGLAHLSAHLSGRFQVFAAGTWVHLVAELSSRQGVRYALLSQQVLLAISNVISTRTRAATPKAAAFPTLTMDMHGSNQIHPTPERFTTKSTKKTSCEQHTGQANGSRLGTDGLQVVHQVLVVSRPGLATDHLT